MRRDDVAHIGQVVFHRLVDIDDLVKFHSITVPGIGGCGDDGGGIDIADPGQREGQLRGIAVHLGKDGNLLRH